MLLFLVLVGNSALFRFLRSYTLLLSPVFMRSCAMVCGTCMQKAEASHYREIANLTLSGRQAGPSPHSELTHVLSSGMITCNM